MSKKHKILIGETKDFSKEVVALLSKYAEVEIRDCIESDIPGILKSYNIFWFRLGFKINSELLENPENICKVLVTPVTGIDHIDEEACKKHNIKIICLRGERAFLKSVRATAELTIGLTLSLLRHIGEASISVKKGFWNRDIFRGNELYGKTAGIIGLGRLGSIVAQYFLAFGMKVIAYDIKDVEHLEGVELKQTLTEVIKEADIVSLHVNYNKNTHHLINRELINLLKTNSVLINTSRGGIIDEEALLDALNNNRIGGAALDVLQGEPTINDQHPLVRYANGHSNLLIVPHIGGNTYESFSKTENFIASKIIELLNKGEV